MKKVSLVFLFLIMVFGSLVGCNKSDEVSGAEKQDSKTQEVSENAQSGKEVNEELQKEELKKQAQQLVTRLNEVHLLKNEQEFEKWLGQVYYEPDNYRDSVKSFLRPGDFTEVKVVFSDDDVVNSPNEDGVFSYISTYTTEITASDGEVFTAEESGTYNFSKNENGEYRILLVQ